MFISGRARARPGYKYRSIEPYNIDRFEQVSEEELTYPQPHYLPGTGFLHLFTKYTGVRELYWETSRDGVRWSDDRKLAGIRAPGDARGGHYQTSARRGAVVGTFFNRHPNGNVDRRTDLYYLQTADGGETWTTVEGELLDTPITEVDSSSRAIDYASLGRNVYLKDMDFDEAGRPALLYVTSSGHQPGPPNDPRYFHVVRWDGEAWTSAVVCPTDHNYDMGSLYLGDEAWQVWVPSSPGPQPYHAGGEIAIWQSGDQGATWSNVQRVTHEKYAKSQLRSTPHERQGSILRLLGRRRPDGAERESALFRQFRRVAGLEVAVRYVQRNRHPGFGSRRASGR